MTGMFFPFMFTNSISFIPRIFSVLIIIVSGTTGITPPVRPVPPPRGIILRLRDDAALMSFEISGAFSGYTITSGYSTRQSVASVT